ncbi:DUF4113 domain-containing protein [Methylobacterium sp. R2-1]|uniref:DUF4113 domain-containing protein n=1 Tax=Methylobacterium sp. R2-1 TaxID=2587064 RepID=UPI00160C386F|nr:DUF4113 domain-containing protein [Methylobacterium sp. R2-1]MBB2964365.1 hypothetical protein [Methylobacterium sp. R2-1]
MGAMDAYNAQFGRGSVVPARAGLGRQRWTWATKFEMLTLLYTTPVDELPIAYSEWLGFRPPADLQPLGSVCPENDRLGDLCGQPL